MAVVHPSRRRSDMFQVLRGVGRVSFLLDIGLIAYEVLKFENADI